MARRLAAIMFTDIAGYTSLAQSDEAGALKLLQEQEKLVRPILETHRGRKVKSIGDGLLIEFPDALDAVECAVELQRRIHEHNSEEGARHLGMRIGIHLGDVQRRGTDILGDAVNIASRIEPLAEPGGVCLSAQVYDQIHNKVAVRLEKLGPKKLKGVREPVDVYWVRLPWAVPDISEGGPSPPRLAVLPLANISPDPKDEYFADGLTEELISVLSQARGLRVIARTSVMPYKSAPKPVAQIGAELGVDSVLEGSVRKVGDQLRIALQLIDARTQEHRWAQTYDRKLENVFAIQAEVAEQTAGALKVELLKSERDAIQERSTSDLAAYELYLRGVRGSHRERPVASEERAQTNEETIRCFEEAIRKDPRYSAAYSSLANHFIALSGSTLPLREVAPRARELVTKALELNPNSSDAHTARGNLAFQADQDWTRAEAEFQQAIALNPSNASARYWYGFLLSVLQRLREAKKQYLAAIELNPLWPSPRVNLMWSEGVISGDRSSAISFGEKVLEEFPRNVDIRCALTWLYAFAGRRADAVRLIEPIAEVSGGDFWSDPSAVLAYLGRPEKTRALLAAWEEGRSPRYVGLSEAAELYAILGDYERSLVLLERDYQEGDRVFWSSYQEPWLDPVRSDPRFVALLRATNLPTTISRPLMPGVSRV